MRSFEMKKRAALAGYSRLKSKILQIVPIRFSHDIAV